jgi:hypothetical protein
MPALFAAEAPLNSIPGLVSLLQKQAYQFGLVSHTGLVENPGQVTARSPLQ